MSISWLLFKNSNRNSLGRLLLMISAIALGVLMVLMFAASINALMERYNRATWQTSLSKYLDPIDEVDPLLITLFSTSNLNKFQNQEINVLGLHATGKNSPQLDAMPTPSNGEYYVSSGLLKVIEENPDDDIGSRYGDKMLGLIPDRYVVSPDSLLVVRGLSEAEANDTTAVAAIYDIDLSQSQESSSMYIGSIAVVLGAGGVILFMPIIIFLVIATQMGSIQREQRYAALRLIGATKNQVSKIILFESIVAALAGIIIGSLLFFAARWLIIGFSFDGLHFWPDDVTVPIMQYIGIVVSVLLLCATANWLGLRRVRLSPLGVIRKQVSLKRPRIFRILPLLFGIGIFVWAQIWGKAFSNADSQNGTILTYIIMVGLLFIMFGLLITGPYLTRRLAELAGKITRRAPTIIAANRIKTQFKIIFRSVSGVVLALFVGSFYVIAVSGVDKLYESTISNNGFSQLNQDVAYISGNRLPNDFGQQLAELSYVESVEQVAKGENGSLINCQHVEIYTKLSCDGAHGYAIINFAAPSIEKPLITDEANSTEMLDYILKLSSNDYIDQLRSFMIANVPQPFVSNGVLYVISGTYAQQAVVSPLIKEFSDLAYVAMGIVLVVAIISLVVSTISSLFERKYSLAMLRIGGMSLRQLKHTVMMEALVPLVATSLISAGLGFWAGSVFISISSDTLTAVFQPIYPAIILCSLLLAVAIIYMILPILNTLTQPESNRTE